MISRSLSRRLERLETSVTPTSTTSDPLVIELVRLAGEGGDEFHVAQSRSPCDAISEKAG
jgi:hypothetical protein